MLLPIGSLWLKAKGNEEKHSPRHAICWASWASGARHAADGVPVRPSGAWLQMAENCASFRLKGLYTAPLVAVSRL